MLTHDCCTQDKPFNLRGKGPLFSSFSMGFFRPLGVISRGPPHTWSRKYSFHMMTCLASLSSTSSMVFTKHSTCLNLRGDSFSMWVSQSIITGTVT